MGLQILRRSNISFRVRARFRELTILIAISSRGANITRTLNNQQQPIVGREIVTVQNPARDYQVVTSTEGNVSEGRLQNTLSLADKHDFIALCVAVKIRGLLDRAYDFHRNITVEQQRRPIHNRISRSS